MSEWVHNARANENSASKNPKGVKVVRKAAPQTRGQLVLEIAEKLRPVITKWFHGKYNDDGMLIQNAHVRGFALNMAERIVKQHYHNDNQASA